MTDAALVESVPRATARRTANVAPRASAAAADARSGGTRTPPSIQSQDPTPETRTVAAAPARAIRETRPSSARSTPAAASAGSASAVSSRNFSG
jgi:hypothetical protein